MKNLYAILSVIFCTLTANAQNVSFLDPAFKNYLVNQITVDLDNDGYPDVKVDTNQDGEIQVSEAEAVNDLTIYSFFRIWDVTGIQAFINLKSLKSQAPILSSTINTLTNLETLDVTYGMIGTTFTLSNMPHLRSIACGGSNIEALHLSGLPNLETLVCPNNALTTLDCSGLTSLKYLNCGYNDLTSLNISALTNLNDLLCNSNPLTSIDLANNVNLKHLEISNFAGTSIDLSHLTQLETLNISGSALTSLDLSHLTSMHTLDCGVSDHLGVLDVSNLPALKFLYCSFGSLTGLNTSGSNNIEEILCGSNQITSIDVNSMPHLIRLWCYDNQLTTLNVGAATALTDLDCKNNLIPNLDVANLLNLQYLNCNNNQISILETTNLVQLRNLACSDNNLSQLNTSLLTGLGNLEFANNHISSVDLANITDLYNLYCQNNNLSSLSIAHFSNLRRLDCSNNQISELLFPTTIPFTNGHNIAASRINCSGNLFTTLDFSTFNSESVYVYVANNPNLTQMNLKNSNSRYSVHSMGNCPNLHYICINDFNENSNIPYGGVFSSIDLVDLENVQINTYCTFNPGGNYNTIAGIFTYDLDGNGCDENDSHSPNSKIQINDGSITGATFTNTSGNYSFYTQSGNFVITPVFENPYFTVSPATATINFTESNGSMQTQHFCVLPNGVHNDVEITLMPLNTARPGFDANYKLVYKNKGNQTLSGNINFTFDDAIFDVVSVNPAFTSQTLNNLHWNYSLLKPFESQSIELRLNLNSPQEIPAVNVGNVLNFTATINPISGDETITDNTATLVQTVRGSVDPNDKTCLEGDTITPEMIGGYVHYMIRFQNSGTAPAEKIVVRDIIDTSKFDISTLELTSTSHAQVTKITGNKVEFKFENINLPFESEDEPGSHGYIAFKIKTKGNLSIGDALENKADIYFDYNFPIETNTATTTVAPLLSTDTFENTSVTVAPNPTKNTVLITAKDNITSVQLFDAQGRLVQTMTVNELDVPFDLSQKTSGVYFLKVYTSKGVKVEKMIKE